MMQSAKLTLKGAIIMLLQKEREEIVAFGKLMLSSGLTRGTGGNLSIFNREKGLMAISPSGIPYEQTEVEDVVIMDLDGNIVEGDRVPSSENVMHAIVYKKRDDVDAMVHVHSTYATTISCLNESLPAVDYLVAFAGGKEVPCAKYATFGTPELAENAIEAMGSLNAVLLANHGMNCVAKDMSTAFAIAEQLEFCAELYVRARSIGTPVILDDAEMERMLVRFSNYGQRKK